MWRPFHKNVHRKKFKSKYDDTKYDDLDFLDSINPNIDDEDELSDFFLKHPKTERLHYENKMIEDIEIGHSSIQGKCCIVECMVII